MTGESRKAFEDLLPELGGVDEFNHYALDEGNLYWLWGKAGQARDAEVEALKRQNRRLTEGLVYAKWVIKGAGIYDKKCSEMIDQTINAPMEG